MVYPLPFCTSGIRFSVYAKYMYFKMNYIYELLHLKSIIEMATIFVTVTSIYIVIKPIIATQRTHHLEKKNTTN